MCVVLGGWLLVERAASGTAGIAASRVCKCHSHTPSMPLTHTISATHTHHQRTSTLQHPHPAPPLDPEEPPPALKGVMHDYKIARMKVVSFMIYITKITPALVQKHITVCGRTPWDGHGMAGGWFVHAVCIHWWRNACPHYVRHAAC